MQTGGNTQLLLESIMALSFEVEEVVKQIRSWPAETRIALARRVLETLDGGSNTVLAGFKGPPAQQVLGMWNPGGTAPTDDECDHILADELRRKHAS
jgi:hypothetical protein